MRYALIIVLLLAGCVSQAMPDLIHTGCERDEQAEEYIRAIDGVDDIRFWLCTYDDEEQITVQLSALEGQDALDSTWRKIGRNLGSEAPESRYEMHNRDILERHNCTDGRFAYVRTTTTILSSAPEVEGLQRLAFEEGEAVVTHVLASQRDKRDLVVVHSHLFGRAHDDDAAKEVAGDLGMLC